MECLRWCLDLSHLHIRGVYSATHKELSNKGSLFIYIAHFCRWEGWWWWWWLFKHASKILFLWGRAIMQENMGMASCDKMPGNVWQNVPRSWSVCTWTLRELIIGSQLCGCSQDTPAIFHTCSPQRFPVKNSSAWSTVEWPIPVPGPMHIVKLLPSTVLNKQSMPTCRKHQVSLFHLEKPGCWQYRENSELELNTLVASQQFYMLWNKTSKSIFLPREGKLSQMK